MNVTGTVAINSGTTLHVKVLGGYCPEGVFGIIAYSSFRPDFQSIIIDNPAGGSATTTPGATMYEVTFSGCSAQPVAVNDAATTAEDTPVIVSVLANDSDPDGDPLTITSVTAPAHGTALANAGATVTYTPALNYFGADSFQYTISDGHGGTATATVDVDVTPVNDPPVAQNDAFTTGGAPVAAPGVLANAVDVDGPSLAAALVAAPAHGAVTLNADGAFVYTPSAGYVGPDNFTYTASDDQFTSNAATVSLTVVPAIVAENDFFTVSQNSSAPSVLTNDTDAFGRPMTAVLVTPPAHGSLTLNADGTFLYAPTPGTSGPDSFTYRAVDGPFQSNIATVAVSNSCSISWTSAANGLWSDGANWDQGRAPVTNDDVCIGIDGRYVVTLNGSQSAASVTIGSSSTGRRTSP